LELDFDFDFDFLIFVGSCSVATPNALQCGALPSFISAIPPIMHMDVHTQATAHASINNNNGTW
jgi:hypothetical protein